jgi:hypothetical protein
LKHAAGRWAQAHPGMRSCLIASARAYLRAQEVGRTQKRSRRRGARELQHSAARPHQRGANGRVLQCAYAPTRALPLLAASSGSATQPQRAKPRINLPVCILNPLLGRQVALERSRGHESAHAAGTKRAHIGELLINDRTAAAGGPRESGAVVRPSCIRQRARDAAPSSRPKMKSMPRSAPVGGLAQRNGTHAREQVEHRLLGGPLEGQQRIWCLDPFHRALKLPLPVKAAKRSFTGRRHLNGRVAIASRSLQNLDARRPQVLEQDRGSTSDRSGTSSARSSASTSAASRPSRPTSLC